MPGPALARASGPGGSVVAEASSSPVPAAVPVDLVMAPVPAAGARAAAAPVVRESSRGRTSVTGAAAGGTAGPAQPFNP